MARLDSPTSPLSPTGRPSILGRVMSPTAHKLLTLITCAALALYFSLPPSHTHLRLKYPPHSSTPSPPPPPIPLPPSALPRAVVGRDLSFTDYLDARFPLPADTPSAHGAAASGPEGNSPTPHVWVTMADGQWARSGARALDVFVRQLNAERRAKYGAGVRETVVVTLCLDKFCVEECETWGMYCYEGYTYNKPPLLYSSTWPKLASMIEVLKKRDIFFVDSDVSFKTDPYPLMEPLMEKFDLVIQENDSWDHFNTGWFWMRQGQAASDAWNAVLEMDKLTKSRDQNRFNEVLGTAPLRQPATPGAPLLREFVALNGLRVHVLDPARVYSWHFERDRPDWPRHEAVALHLTCGDDEPVKVFVQKALGFWPDVGGYYARPPRVLSWEHLGGTREEVAKAVRVGLAAGRYAGRAVVPPSHVVFTDVREGEGEAGEGGGESHISSLPSYSAFPWAHMEREFGGEVAVLEPGYPAHAAKHLLGGSVLARESVRLDPDYQQKEEGEGGTAAALALALLTPVTLDLRQASSFPSLLALLTSPPFATAHHVRLTNLNLPSAPAPQSESASELGGLLHLPLRADRTGPEAPFPGGWRAWPLPEPVGRVVPCAHLELPPWCEKVCRTEFGWRVTVAGEWPSVGQLEEQGEGEGGGKRWDL